jgi:hypothetical protein
MEKITKVTKRNKHLKTHRELRTKKREPMVFFMLPVQTQIHVMLSSIYITITNSFEVEPVIVYEHDECEIERKEEQCNHVSIIVVSLIS